MNYNITDVIKPITILWHHIMKAYRGVAVTLQTFLISLLLDGSK